MTDLYPAIRSIHVAAVIFSGCLFATRGLAQNAVGAGWAMARPVRYLSYGVDTVLLAAAISLMVILRQYPGTDAWLTAKVILLPIYIGLGTFALKRGRTRGTRMLCFVLALLVYGFIVSIALTHGFQMREILGGFNHLIPGY